MKRDLYAEVTDRIIAKLEAGVMPWIKGWNGGASIPMNAISNRPYSGINLLLFFLAEDKGYSRPRFMTFNQAKESGGTVRAGEKSTRIIYFKQLQVRDRSAPTSDPDALKMIPMLKEYYVFNVDQCNGLPERIRKGADTDEANPDTREALADSFIKTSGADFREGAGRPCYIPSRDFITVPAWSNFHSMPEYYAAAFHELIHWTGHKARLDRDLKSRFDTDAYAAEELIAELGAAFLCAEFGFDNAHANQAAYLDHWLKILKADKRAIFTAASQAQKAADYLRGKALEEPQSLAA